MYDGMESRYPNNRYPRKGINHPRSSVDTMFYLMSGIICDARKRWNRNLRSVRTEKRLSQEQLAAQMRELGFSTCTQKSISKWEQVGQKPNYVFPPYEKMVGLAKCLEVDVPYLTGDMDGRTYAEEYIAKAIGTDPGVTSLINALRLHAPETSSYEDNGETAYILTDNGADETALFILDFTIGNEFISKYKKFIAAWMDVRPQDDITQAKHEQTRYEKELRAAKFDLVDTFQALLHTQYPDPDLDAFLTEKGQECKRKEEQERERIKKKMTKKLSDNLSDDQRQNIISTLRTLAEASTTAKTFHKHRIDALRHRIAAKEQAMRNSANRTRNVHSGVHTS